MGISVSRPLGLGCHELIHVDCAYAQEALFLKSFSRNHNPLFDCRLVQLGCMLGGNRGAIWSGEPVG